MTTTQKATRARSSGTGLVLSPLQRQSALDQLGKDHAALTERAREAVQDMNVEILTGHYRGRIAKVVSCSISDYCVQLLLKIYKAQGSGFLNQFGRFDSCRGYLPSEVREVDRDHPVVARNLGEGA